MSESRQVLRLFLASSSDVAGERKIVREVVDSWNRTVGVRRGWQVDVFGYDSHGSPDYGSDPQDIVNRQIGNMGRYALFVGLLKHRFGTPTPRAGSGTNEEFKRAVKAFEKTGRLRIMLYFSEAPFRPHNEEDMKQKQKVMDFRQQIQSLSLHWGYHTQKEFRQLFTEHFHGWMEDQMKSAPKTAPPVRSAKDKEKPPSKKPISKSPGPAHSGATATSKKKAVTGKTQIGTGRPTKQPNTAAQPQPKRLLLLDDSVFHVGDVNENADGTKWTVIFKPKSPAEDSRLRALQGSQNRHKRMTLAFQYQGGFATIESGERSSNDKDGDFWTFKLSVTRPNASGMEFSFNGTSAAQLAQMRATWLLLGEKPATTDRWIETHVRGQGEENTPILPALWKRVKGDGAQFGEAAPLLVVSRLLTSGICEDILDLKLGPRRARKMKVTFRGRRTPAYGQKPDEIVVEGTCVLEP